jgi:hypothetical protein
MCIGQVGTEEPDGPAEKESEDEEKKNIVSLNESLQTCLYLAWLCRFNSALV